MPMAGETLPAEMERMPTDDSMLQKAKRDSVHQPCGPVYPSASYSSPASSIYVKPYIPQTYLKKELGVAQSHLAHLQSYVQHPTAYTGTVTVPRPSIAYVKPVAPSVIDYHHGNYLHQPMQYIKPAASVYQRPTMLSYAPVYQKPLYYAPMSHEHAMPKIILKKYQNVVAPVYQKPLLHVPPAAIQYAAPKVVQVQPPQVSYVKPVVHPSSPIYVPPIHNSVIVKPPHCE